MRRVLRLAQARAGLSNEVRDTRCRKSRCVRIHRAVPQPEDAAKTRQAGSEVLNPFTTVRDFGVERIVALANSSAVLQSPASEPMSGCCSALAITVCATSR